MKKLSGFDLGMIIAFAVVTLLGAGAWWYLSGQLDVAKDDVEKANEEFDKYSNKQIYLPTEANENTLQDNIDLIQSKLNPLIQSKLQSKENKLPTIEKQDPVVWKHDLDEEVRRLTTAARRQNVVLPPKFYYGFSRYLNQNPSDEQTLVLNKQLLGIEQITTILLNAPVRDIQDIKRTYEEEKASQGVPTGNAPGPGQQATPGFLPGYSFQAPGDAYTSYPFEFDFETTTQNLRKIIDDLIQSPYVFVVRSLTIINSKPHSPLIADLDKLVGTPTPSVVDSSPGAVAATTSTQGPQYLFGAETLHIKARIDMIEWNAEAAAAPPVPIKPHHRDASASTNISPVGNASPGGNTSQGGNK